MKTSFLHRLRRRERRFALGVLPLFCLVWLQLAAAPCAAFHSGPAEAHQHAAPVAGTDAGHAHHGSGDLPGGDSHGEAPPCAWCPPQDDAGHCDDGSRCSFPHEPQVDARLPFVFLPSPEIPVHPVTADAPVGLLRSAEERPVPAARRSLAIHYCRFIE